MQLQDSQRVQRQRIPRSYRPIAVHLTHTFYLHLPSKGSVNKMRSVHRASALCFYTDALKIAMLSKKFPIT